MNLAHRAGRVPSNGAWMSVAKFKGVDRSRNHFLSVDECRRLINAAGDEFRPMVQAALQTGCRYAELCNLKVADFHVDSKTLHIRTSKTGRSRNVYLTEEGVQLFRVSLLVAAPMIRSSGAMMVWRLVRPNKFDV